MCLNLSFSTSHQKRVFHSDEHVVPLYIHLFSQSQTCISLGVLQYKAWLFGQITKYNLIFYFLDHKYGDDRCLHNFWLIVHTFFDIAN
jgi:hypothetical protein